jgi:hypothetical protein
MKKLLGRLAAVVLAAALQVGLCGLAMAQNDQTQPSEQPTGNDQYQQGSDVMPAAPNAAPQATTEPEYLPVLFVTSVEVIRTTVDPHEDIVWVNGLTATVGWGQPELVPLFVGYGADGILDLQFIAQAPLTSQQAQGFVPISAAFPIEPGHTFKGVRVRGAANVVEVKTMPGVAQAKVMTEDCATCVGKLFASKGTAAPGAPGVIREEDLPRNFRVIPPTKGVAGITHNMNRLNLVLGDDGKTIVWAFWE